MRVVMTNVSEINIQSIKILQNLYSTKNTYKTAHELNISQSKVSRVLARLRDDLGDRLLIRVGNNLHPTDYFTAIQPGLTKLVQDIDSVFFVKEFDASRHQGDIRLAISRGILYRFGVQLYQHLSMIAPFASWHFEEWNDSTIERIECGTVDIGINYENEVSKHIVLERIIRDEFFALASKQFISEHKIIKLEELWRLPFISWNPTIVREINEVRDIIKVKYKKDLRIVLTTDSLDVAVEACLKGKGLLISTKRLVSEDLQLNKLQLPPEIHQDRDLNRYIAFFTSYLNSKSDKCKLLKKEISTVLVNSLSDLP